MWNHTQKLKGFGYVEFVTEEGAYLATRKSGMKVRAATKSVKL
jgi:hypothetical protein